MENRVAFICGTLSPCIRGKEYQQSINVIDRGYEN